MKTNILFFTILIFSQVSMAASEGYCKCNAVYTDTDPAVYLETRMSHRIGDFKFEKVAAFKGGISDMDSCMKRVNTDKLCNSLTPLEKVEASVTPTSKPIKHSSH